MSIEEAIESLNSPGQLATTQFYNIKNNCASVLNATIDAIQTSLVLVAGGGALFPAAPFYLSCEYEVMKCTGKSTDTLTITRGFDGTTAAAHTAGVIVEQRNNAALWTDLQLAVNNIESGSTSIPFNPPAGSIANATLASDVARPNLLQNGGFEQWHYGIGPINTNTATIADGWVISGLTSGTMSVSRDSANADVGSVYCAAVVFVRTAVNVDITQVGSLLTPQLRGQTISVAVRVKTNVANAVRLRVNDAITGQQFSSFHTGNNTYQTLALTYPVALAATTLNVAVEFDNSCTAYIDNATLVIGTQAANYIPAQIPDVIPNERLASDVARANLLTNGGFEIWQRSTGTIPITVSGTYHADRWQGFLVGTSTLTVAADTTNQDTGSWRCAQCVVTSATLAGPAFVYQQIISAFASGEGQQLRGRVLSFSVRVKTSVANACRIVISDATSSVATYSGYHTGSGTYETLRVTCPAISANCTNANVGIYFEGNGTYFLDNACLVVGAIPADYVPLHSADDLARCLRYYETIVANSNQYISFAFVYGITTAMGIWQMLPKAITPTATLSAGNTWGVTNNGFGVVPCTAIGATIQTARIVSFSLTTAGGLVAGNSAVVLANTGQTATMTLESNP